MRSGWTKSRQKVSKFAMHSFLFGGLITNAQKNPATFSY